MTGSEYRSTHSLPRHLIGWSALCSGRFISGEKTTHTHWLIGRAPLAVSIFCRIDQSLNNTGYTADTRFFSHAVCRLVTASHLLSRFRYIHSSNNLLSCIYASSFLTYNFPTIVWQACLLQELFHPLWFNQPYDTRRKAQNTHVFNA